MMQEQQSPLMLKRLRWYDSLENEGKSSLAFELDDKLDRALKNSGLISGAGWGKVKVTSAGKSYLASQRKPQLYAAAKTISSISTIALKQPQRPPVKAQSLATG